MIRLFTRTVAQREAAGSTTVFRDQMLAGYAKVAEAARVAAEKQIEAARTVVTAQDETAVASQRSAEKQVQANQRVASSAVRSAEEQKAAFGSARSEITRFGRDTLLGLTGAAAGSVYLAAKFQTLTTQLTTQAGVSRAAVKQLSAGLLDMAASVGQTPDQLAGGMYHIASSLNNLIAPAKRVQTELGIMKVAAMGAGVGGSNLTETTYVLSAAMNALGEKTVPQARRTMAELNAIVGSGDMHLQDLNSALSTGILASARTFGVSLRSVGAALAVLADKGEPAQKAATALRMGMIEMAAPTKIAAGILQTLGLSSRQAISSSEQMSKMLQKAGVSTTEIAIDLRKPDGFLVALQDLKRHMMAAGLTSTGAAAAISRSFGGVKGATVVEQLYQSLGKLQSKYVQIGTTTNQFGADWKQTTQTLAFQFHQVEAELEVVGIRLGDFLMPKVEAGINDLKLMVHWFEQNKVAAGVLAGGITALATVAIGSYLTSKVKGAATALRELGSVFTSTSAKRVGAGTLGAAGGGLGGVASAATGGLGIGGVRSGMGLPGSMVNPIVVAIEAGEYTGLGSESAAIGQTGAKAGAAAEAGNAAAAGTAAETGAAGAGVAGAAAADAGVGLAGAEAGGGAALLAGIKGSLSGMLERLLPGAVIAGAGYLGAQAAGGIIGGHTGKTVATVGGDTALGAGGGAIIAGPIGAAVGAAGGGIYGLAQTGILKQLLDSNATQTTLGPAQAKAISDAINQASARSQAAREAQGAALRHPNERVRVGLPGATSADTMSAATVSASASGSTQAALIAAYEKAHGGSLQGANMAAINQTAAQAGAKAAADMIEHARARAGGAAPVLQGPPLLTGKDLAALAAAFDKATLANASATGGSQGSQLSAYEAAHNGQMPSLSEMMAINRAAAGSGVKAALPDTISYGQTAGTILGSQSAQDSRFIDEKALADQAKAAFANLPPIAQAAAAQTLDAYVKEFAQSGRLADGTYKAFQDDLSGFFLKLPANASPGQAAQLISQDFQNALNFAPAQSSLSQLETTIKGNFSQIPSVAKLTFGNTAQVVNEQLNYLKSVAANSTGQAKVTALANFSDLKQGTIEYFSQTRENIAQTMTSIVSQTGAGSQSAKQAASTAFHEMAASIQREMASGVLSVGQGNQLIVKELNQALKALGDKQTLSAPTILSLSSGQLAAVASGQVSPGAAASPHATGGLIQLGRPGEAGRDSIPLSAGGTNIVAAPGEQIAVFTRHQQAVANRMLAPVGGLPGLFGSVSTPNYMASGGLVGQSPYALPLPASYLHAGSVDQGVDYPAPAGTPEYAIAAGTIAQEGISGFGGYAPVLHLDKPILGFTNIYYGHAGPDVVPVGTHVTAGQQISEVGDSFGGIFGGLPNISTGPHIEIGFGPPFSTGAPMLGFLNSLLAGHPAAQAAAGTPGTVGAGAGAGAPVTIPTLAKPAWTGPGGAVGAMGQAVISAVLQAAQAKLQAAAGAAGGAVAGGVAGVIGKIGSLQDLNHVFPANGGTQLSPQLVAQIANWAGLPGQIFSEIAHGESDYEPGAVEKPEASGAQGFGLWQITTGVGNDQMIAGLGGTGAMLNPLVNARAARNLYLQGGLSPWHGTQYVPSAARGLLLEMAKGGIVPKTIRAGSTKTTTRTSTPKIPAGKPKTTPKGRPSPRTRGVRSPFKADTYANLVAAVPGLAKISGRVQAKMNELGAGTGTGLMPLITALSQLSGQTAASTPEAFTQFGGAFHVLPDDLQYLNPLLGEMQSLGFPVTITPGMTYTQAWDAYKGSLESYNGYVAAHGQDDTASAWSTTLGNLSQVLQYVGSDGNHRMLTGNDLAILKFAWPQIAGTPSGSLNDTNLAFNRLALGDLNSVDGLMGMMNAKIGKDSKVYAAHQESTLDLEQAEATRLANLKAQVQDLQVKKLKQRVLAAQATYTQSMKKYDVQQAVGSSRVDLQACKLEYSIVSPK